MVDYLDWRSAIASVDATVEATINLLVQLKKDSRLPNTTFSNNDGNFSNGVIQ